MKLGAFKVIAEPDQPARWLHKNVRVKGYVGEVERPTDQYIRRPVDHMFQEACITVKGVLPSGECLNDADVNEYNCARIVEVKEIDDYGSLLFKWEYWGVPEK